MQQNEQKLCKIPNDVQNTFAAYMGSEILAKE